MIRRTMDADFLNRVANHVDVRPALGGQTPIDLAPLIADPENIALVTEWGGFLLARHDVATFEAHTMFLPQGRGAHAVAAIKEGLRYLFTATPCADVVTKVAVSNRPAALLLRQSGFERRFRREGAWTEADGTPGPMDFLGLTLDRWTAADDRVEALGGTLHERLAAARRRANLTAPATPEGAALDRAAGAAALMIRAGNAGKGVWTYNRWARLAQCPLMRLLTDTPAVIELGGVIAEFNAFGTEVLSCRQDC